MSLTGLPPELVSCVLASIKSQPTLCNLARCSSQLYLYKIPHLYSHVTVHEEFGFGVQENGQLRSVASLLIQRPISPGLFDSLRCTLKNPVER